MKASQSPLQAAGADPLGCIEKDQGSPAGLKKAWQLFIADGRYRIAREDDFSLPDTAIAKRLHERTVCPVDPGDFNHDGKWYDLAVIIVDTTRVGLDRFGLVIFNRQKNDEETYVPYWLYNNRDLSKNVLNGLKDDLAVSELREDGSMFSCHVKWDIKQKSYRCGKTAEKLHWLTIYEITKVRHIEGQGYIEPTTNTLPSQSLCPRRLGG